jgi:hypothetical protein
MMHAMSNELATTGPRRSPATFEASLEAEQAVERTLMRTIAKAIVIAVPLGMIFFISLLAIAMGGDTEWYVIVGLGSALGLVGAVLFGMLGGVTLVAHTLDAVDTGAAH